MYWGIKDSSSFFCEEPYTNSKYIAEYYNTVSAIPYILIGIYIYYVLNYYKIGLSVVSIGLGTILLHSTQRYYGQWADEMSMLFFCFSVIQRLNKRINNYFLGILYSVYFAFNEYWIIFVLLFGCMVKYMFYLLKHKKHYKESKVNVTISIFIVSTIAWIVDQISCHYIGNTYFHTLWHVGTALAILHGVLYL